MPHEDPNHPLELSVAEMRRLVGAAAERVIDHIVSLPEQPAANVERDAEVARSAVEPLPLEGAPVETLLDRVVELAATSFNTAGPGYLAYIPGGGLFHSAVADLVSASLNRYVGVWQAAPGLVQLESNVVRWFCEMVGYPPEAGGILTSGGSLANFSAVVAARCERLPENFLNGTIYTSDQIHHSVLKAATLAGFPRANVRILPVDRRFALRTDLLEEKIAADREGGFTPFLIVGSAGTTNTGAVDALDTLADIAARERCWLHVDAAYGGFFALTERGRAALAGLERADSLTLDPHKALFLPYGTGSLLVRRPATLRDSHSVQADYMPPMQDDDERADFCELSPELSRAFRGLRVWLPLRMHGIAPFRAALDEKLDLARWAAEELRAVDGIEIVAEPQLSVLAFRLGRDDDVNRDLLRRVNARGRVYLTGTMAAGGFVLRICVLNFRTHRERVEAALEDIRAAIAELRG